MCYSSYAMLCVTDMQPRSVRSVDALLPEAREEMRLQLRLSAPRGATPGRVSQDHPVRPSRHRD